MRLRSASFLASEGISLARAMCGSDPGEIAAGVFGIQETVQKIWIGRGQIGIFALEADQKPPVPAQCEETGNRRAGTVGADEETCACVELGKDDELPLPFGI